MMAYCRGRLLIKSNTKYFLDKQNFLTVKQSCVIALILLYVQRLNTAYIECFYVFHNHSKQI